jgi:hypothetical protein
MRQPLVAGVAGGVGTTTIAVALKALDWDLYIDGTAVDVLVCRSTVYSLGEAHRSVGHTPYPPILAVVADVPDRARLAAFPSAVRARTRMVEPHVAGAVAVPFVPEWRTRDKPYDDAARALDPAAETPAWLADFAAAMRRLVGLLESAMDVPNGSPSRLNIPSSVTM